MTQTHEHRQGYIMNTNEQDTSHDTSNNTIKHIRRNISLKDIYVETPDVLPIPVCIPENTFFKVRPDRKLNVCVMEDEGTWYLVSKAIVNGKHIAISRNVLHATLYQCITEEGRYFILPCYMKHKKPDATADDYDMTLQGTINQSILEDRWISLEYLKDFQEYEFLAASDDDLENISDWPDSGTFEETIAAAFQDDLYIDSKDHPLFKHFFNL